MTEFKGLDRLVSFKEASGQIKPFNRTKNILVSIDKANVIKYFAFEEDTPALLQLWRGDLITPLFYIDQRFQNVLESKLKEVKICGCKKFRFDCANHDKNPDVRSRDIENFTANFIENFGWSACKAVIYPPRELPESMLD